MGKHKEAGMLESSYSVHEIKQAIIRIIDYTKYPWYHLKYTDKIVKIPNEQCQKPEAILKKKYIKSDNMEQPDETKSDNVNPNINKTKHKPKVTSDICVKLKYDAKKKVWAIKNKQKKLTNTNKETLTQAINENYKDIIDFSNNIGLVGVTVKHKLIVDDDAAEPDALTLLGERDIEYKNRLILGGGKYSLHKTNKEGSKYLDKPSVDTSAREIYIIEQSTLINSSIEVNETLNVICDKVIDKKDTTKELLGKVTENCSIESRENERMANSLQSQGLLNKKQLVETQMDISEKNGIFNNPIARTTKEYIKLPADNEKMNMEKKLDSGTRTSKPERYGVQSELSKTNCRNLCPKEQSFGQKEPFQVQILNYNKQNEELTKAQRNSIGQVNGVPAQRPPTIDRVSLNNNFTQQRYYGPSPVMQNNYAWQSTQFNRYSNSNFNSVYRPYGRFHRPPLLPNPYDPMRLQRPSQNYANTMPVDFRASMPYVDTQRVNFASRRFNNIEINSATKNKAIPVRLPSRYRTSSNPVNCVSINNTRNIKNIKNVVASNTNNNNGINCTTKIETTINKNSALSNSIPIISQEIESHNSIVLNDITDHTTTVLDNRSNNKKHIHNENNDSINVHPLKCTPTEAKKCKIENISGESTDDSENEATLSSTGYSPPILPIPSYKSMFSLLRLRNLNTRMSF